MNAQESTSTRPYLIRALYEWCTDNALTPYVAVLVDETVQVPREYVKNGEIVLNISFDATSSLKLGNDFIEFKARFAGVAREILVPISRVIAIYARENGQGMAFPVAVPASDTTPSRPSPLTSVPAAGTPSEGDAKVFHLAGGTLMDMATDEGTSRVDGRSPGEAPTESASDSADDDGSPPTPRPPSGPRPSLKRVK